MVPTLWRGYKRALTFDDLRPLPKEFTTEYLYEKFLTAWDSFVERKRIRMRNETRKTPETAADQVDMFSNGRGMVNKHDTADNNNNEKINGYNHNISDNSHRDSNNMDAKSRDNTFDNKNNNTAKYPSVIKTLFYSIWREIVELLLKRILFVALDLLKPVILGWLIVHVNNRPPSNGDSLVAKEGKLY